MHAITVPPHLAASAGDDEARARGTQKTVLERVAPPTFPLVIEMRERAYWVTHWVEDSVDCLLHGKVPIVQARSSSPAWAYAPGFQHVGGACLFKLCKVRVRFACADEDAYELTLCVLAVPSAASPVCASMHCNVRSA